MQQQDALTIWHDYKNTGVGYYEYLAGFVGFLPGIVRTIAIVADFLLRYFFELYYYLLPLYISFLGAYYRFYFGKIFSAVFY